jgi:hypothetical protein
MRWSILSLKKAHTYFLVKLATRVLLQMCGYSDIPVTAQLHSLIDPVKSWEKVEIFSTSPAARFFHTSIYVSRIDRFIVFGGQTSNSFFGDTWLFSTQSATWDQLISSFNPTPRSRHVSFFVGTLVFVGLGSGASDAVFSDEMFELDLSSQNPGWSPKIGFPTLPSTNTLISASNEKIGLGYLCGGSGSSIVTDGFVFQPLQTIFGDFVGRHAVVAYNSDFVVYGGSLFPHAYSVLLVSSSATTSDFFFNNDANNNDRTLGIILGSFFGGMLIVTILAFVPLCIVKYRARRLRRQFAYNNNVVTIQTTLQPAVSTVAVQPQYHNHVEGGAGI